MSKNGSFGRSTLRSSPCSIVLQVGAFYQVPIPKLPSPYGGHHEVVGAGGEGRFVQYATDFNRFGIGSK
jgi:hypothetical protein